MLFLTISRVITMVTSQLGVLASTEMCGLEKEPWTYSPDNGALKLAGKWKCGFKRRMRPEEKRELFHLFRRAHKT